MAAKPKASTEAATPTEDVTPASAEAPTEPSVSPPVDKAKTLDTDPLSKYRIELPNGLVMYQF
jgi:hypothetical protein